MLEAIIWGLVQGLTEFLPVSSSGHLRLVPDLFGMEAPDLATSAVLHLGTLVAVVAFFRADIGWIARGLDRAPAARRVFISLAVATVPAAIAGATLTRAVERFQESATAVGAALLVTGSVLLASYFIPHRTGRIEEVGPRDAFGIGLFQALALLPGISRSGMVITAGMMRGLSATEAARFGFLMAVPVTLGAGVREAMALSVTAISAPQLVAGTAVAALSGYWAISLLTSILARKGLWPFALYCGVAGTIALLRL
ncbi:MAG: undecaprenyl-diphosphate phosphatase [bacterium]|nr:undecaprenyl-diphosphate phosphatase [bacterium]